MSNNLAFYIITTNYHQSQNIYKIGIHTGNPYDLITRYITYFPDVIITYFQYTDKAKKVESDLKEKLSKCRITNIKGNLSEWIVID
ncbi:T5orf172 domain-containing protein [Acanthamoeba castellanii mamavirus]|nr:T5orf172 domain-containing protein [Acanthamoeba castellanii mamavirus]